MALGPAPWPRSDQDIVALRPAKAAVDPRRPYAFLVEDEHGPTGAVEPVATLFLTNKECPFRCIMCDLWRHTTDERVPVGAIPEQIDWALARLPLARHIKLYNSGNFFDAQAIPPEDYAAIAERVRSFQTVIVENHPRLCGDACFRFRDLLPPECQLEVALGLETVHPEALARMNKRMTLDDFAHAARRLKAGGIELRAFVLIRPPPLSEAEGVEWALRTLDFAWEHGVRVACVIPTRATHGVMVQLEQAGYFAPPSLASVEEVFERGLAQRRGRLFVDLWDGERLEACALCGAQRLHRLRQMNLTQQPLPPEVCRCGA